MGIFSNQTECDAIYQLCSTSSVCPTVNSSLQSQHYLEDCYIPIFALIYIYPKTVGVVIIEVWFRYQVLQFTFCIIDITEEILLAI